MVAVHCINETARDDSFHPRGGRLSLSTVLLAVVYLKDNNNFNLLFSYVIYNVPQSVLKEPPR